MNRIVDPRVLFYLRHQERIDEWSALPQKAAEVAHEFLWSCKRDAQSLAKSLGPNVKVDDGSEGTYSGFSLFRPSWRLGGNEEPGVAVSLEWRRSPRSASPSFTSAENCPYCGVSTNIEREGGPELYATLKGSFADLVRKHDLRSTPWWPARRDLRATGEYWNDLTAYRQQIRASLEFFWRTFEPLIEKALR